MAIIYQFSKRTFRDITNEGVVDVDKVTADFIGSVIKVYERKGTIIVHIKDKKVNHASISNTNGQVKEWEIKYAIEQVLKSEIKDVLVHVSRTGVIHVCTKEEILLSNRCTHFAVIKILHTYLTILKDIESSFLDVWR